MCIRDSIPAIIDLAQKCDHITEMGVRTVVSTWGWLGGAPKNGLISYDILNPKYWNKPGQEFDPIQDVIDTAEAYNIKFKFIEADVCNIEIEEKRTQSEDLEHFHDVTKIDYQRRKRLREDYEKDESEKLSQLETEFLKNFNLSLIHI